MTVIYQGIVAVIYKIAVEMDRQRLAEAKTPKKIDNSIVDERNARFRIKTSQNEKWKSERHPLFLNISPTNDHFTIAL